MSTNNQIISEKMKGSKRVFSSGWSNLIPFLGLMVVIVVFWILSEGRIASTRNIGILFNEVFSIGLATAGILFVMTQGNMDFSIAANVGAGAAVAATLARDLGVTWIIFPASLVFCIVVGIVNGFVVAKLNISSFVATLGMSFILRGFTMVLCDGSIGVASEMKRFDNLFLRLVVIAVVFVLFYITFEYTKFGKSCKSIGAQAEASRQVGINLFRTRLMAYAISGAIAGIIAFFSIARSTTAANNTGTGLEFNALLALMIGGFSLTGGWSSKFRSIIVGSLIIAFISNGMTLSGIEGILQQIVKGVLFLVAVTVSFDRKSVQFIK